MGSTDWLIISLAITSIDALLTGVYAGCALATLKQRPFSDRIFSSLFNISIMLDKYNSPT